MTLCDACTNVDGLGRCLVQPWLMPGYRRSDAPETCRMWRGDPQTMLATLRHRLEVIEENRHLRARLGLPEFGAVGRA